MKYSHILLRARKIEWWFKFIYYKTDLDFPHRSTSNRTAEKIKRSNLIVQTLRTIRF